MTRAVLAIATAAGLVLAGCAVDQRQEVETYRSVTRLGDVPKFARGDALTLADALKLANAHNEQLSIEGERYLQALIERRRRVANLLPTFDFFADLNVRENNRTTRPTSFDAGFSGQYTLMTGMTDLRNVDAASADARARRWLLLDLREVLMLETARAYYAVLQAERLVEVLESSTKVQAERLRDIQGRQRVGFARPLDVAQIEAQVSETRVTLLDARNSVARARSALTLLTGVETGESDLTDGLDAIGMPDVDGSAVLKRAYTGRHDLQAARDSAESARFTVDAAIGQYWPSVSISGDFFLTRESTPDDLDLAGLIAVNLPIFSAGRIEADVREAWSIYRQRVLEFSALRRQVRSDVEVATADLAVSRERVSELDTQVKAAAETLRQAEAAYTAGLGTNLERISAQDQLLSAQLRQVSEAFTLKLARLAIERAAGRLTDQIAGTRSPEPVDEPPAPISPFIVTPPAGGHEAVGGMQQPAGDVRAETR